MISFITLTLLAIMASILVFGFVWAVRRNVQRSNQVRKKMEVRLKELRLYKVLNILRIDVKNYLHKNSIVDIEEHMRTCNSCTGKEYCDDHLCKMLSASEFCFCPNYLKLVDISAKT